MMMFDCPQCGSLGERVRGDVQADAVYRCERCGGEVVFVALRFTEARARLDKILEGAPRHAGPGGLGEVPG